MSRLRIEFFKQFGEQKIDILLDDGLPPVSGLLSPKLIS